jgi:hypothetical protein
MLRSHAGVHRTLVSTSKSHVRSAPAGEDGSSASSATRSAVRSRRWPTLSRTANVLLGTLRASGRLALTTDDERVRGSLFWQTPGLTPISDSARTPARHPLSGTPWTRSRSMGGLVPFGRSVPRCATRGQRMPAMRFHQFERTGRIAKIATVRLRGYAASAFVASRLRRDRTAGQPSHFTALARQR